MFTAAAPVLALVVGTVADGNVNSGWVVTSFGWVVTAVDCVVSATGSVPVDVEVASVETTGRETDVVVTLG